MKKDIVTNLKSLRIKSEEVSSKEAKEIIKDLEDTLKDCPTGVGLSAIQIGIPKKVSIIRLEGLRLDLINPEIIEKDGRFKKKKEGCLSFPSLYVNTIRYNTVTIINNGKTETYYDIIAVCLQHEIDHMRGITILDRKWGRR